MNHSTFSLKISYDQSPDNPFTNWDCEPPVMYRYDRNVTHYGTNSIVSELLDLITPRQLVLNRKELLDAIEVEEDELENNNGYCTLAENLRAELSKWWDTLDLVEALARISKTPHLRYNSREYSQGDYADVLIILTPDFFKRTGCNLKDSDTILKGTRQLFDAWIWWDVYEYQLIEHKPLFQADGTPSDTTDDDIIDSCWWFYGDDFDTNGLRDSIPAEHRHLIDDACNHIS